MWKKALALLAEMKECGIEPTEVTYRYDPVGPESRMYTGWFESKSLVILFKRCDLSMRQWWTMAKSPRTTSVGTL